MIPSITDEIERAWYVFNAGNVEEALQIINQLEKQKDISPEDHIKCQIAEGLFLISLGNFKEAADLSHLALQESLKHNKPLLSIDAIVNLYVSTWWLSHLSVKAQQSSIERCENLLKSASEDINNEIEQREALIYLLKGWSHSNQGEVDVALEYLRKSSGIFEKYQQHFYLFSNLRFIGETYTNKGEFEEALKAQKRGLSFSKGNSFMQKVLRGASYYDIGKIYYGLGELDKAIRYFEEALNEFGDLNGIAYAGYTYEKIIKIYLDKGLIDKAKEYLNYFKNYNQQEEIWGGRWQNLMSYRLSKARILKTTSRTRNWTEAETLLKEIIEEMNQYVQFEFPDAIIELCDFYLQELMVTNDLEIIKDIEPYIQRLIKESKRTKSYPLRAMTYLLQGKIALLQLNMGDARKYLTKAQKIAEEHGLKLLAQKISMEHDDFLVQLDQWEGFKRGNVSVSERMRLVSLDETMEHMQGRRALENKELVNEHPLFILIMVEGGVPVFSYSFKDKWNHDNELFGSFISAFTSFSDEFFSEGLDRVKFGQNTVILESLKDFSICYVFKGPSYLAKQKLHRFSNHIKNHNSIMKTLDRFSQTSQVLEIKDFPFLEAFMTEIFQSPYQNSA